MPSLRDGDRLFYLLSPTKNIILLTLPSMKHKVFFDRLLAWLRSYFKHPLPNLRTAKPIVPKRLYDNFGYVVKPVPLSAEEKRAMKHWPDHALPTNILATLHTLSAIARFYDENPVGTDVPARCNFCDLYKRALPCPLENTLSDGSIVCEHCKYIIIKSPDEQ